MHQVSQFYGCRIWGSKRLSHLAKFPELQVKELDFDYFCVFFFPSETHVPSIAWSSLWRILDAWKVKCVRSINFMGTVVMGVGETGEAQARVWRLLHEEVRRREEIKLKKISQVITFTKMVNYSSFGWWNCSKNCSIFEIERI